MAGRIRNRRELRDQADAAAAQSAAATPASETEAEADVATPATPRKRSKAKAPAVPRVRKPRAKKAAPRMRARWGVFDASMKQVAIFDYNQRAEADEKLALLQAQKKGTFFLQIVKEAMPEPEEAAAVAD